MSKRHAAPEPTGVPLSLPLDLIDEDPRQEGELLLVKEPSAAGRVWLKTHAGEVDAVGTDVFILELRLA